MDPVMQIQTFQQIIQNQVFEFNMKLKIFAFKFK